MSTITDDAKRHHLTVYIPDTRGVTVSRFGRGNLKIGLDVYTYSRLPGLPGHYALGIDGASEIGFGPYNEGTCPGATPECQSICYASRPVAEQGAVMGMWQDNSVTEEVPDELPYDCVFLRLHVSGDFTSERYIDGWTNLIARNPHVKVWAYTRSWRVPALLPALERLRALSNVQLFASMDLSTEEMPPAGWRRAWIDGDERAGQVRSVHAHSNVAEMLDDFEVQRTSDDVKALICPEETKAVANCVECGFCFHGTRNDVIFLKH